MCAHKDNEGSGMEAGNLFSTSVNGNGTSV